MKITLWLSVFLLLSLPLTAQDSEADIFADGAFDSAVASGQASEEINKLVWLGGVSLASTSTVVVPESGDSYGSLSQFAGKGFLKATKPSVGALFLSYTYGHTLWAAATNPTLKAGYARQALDPATPDYRLSEFHLSFDWNKTIFVRVGNQLIDWGASAVWSPADFINRRTADPNAPLDTRAGKPGVRVHVPWASGNFFLFADASASLTKNGDPRDLARTGTLGFKADTTVAGWNLGFVANGGVDAGGRLGLTASGAVLGIDLWGEAGAVLPLADKAFSWSASLGGERSFGVDSEWTLRAEGFWNPGGQGATVLTPAELATFTPYYWGQVYLYSEVLKKKLVGPDVTGSLSATGNLSDRSWSGTASLRTAFSGFIPLSVFVQYAGGEPNREFTLASGSPAWTFGLRSVTEF